METNVAQDTTRPKRIKFLDAILDLRSKTEDHPDYSQHIERLAAAQEKLAIDLRELIVRNAPAYTTGFPAAVNVLGAFDIRSQGIRNEYREPGIATPICSFSISKTGSRISTSEEHLIVKFAEDNFGTFTDEEGKTRPNYRIVNTAGYNIILEGWLGENKKDSGITEEIVHIRTNVAEAA